VAGVMDSYSRIINFLDWSRYFFFQVAPQLYSRGREETPVIIHNCDSDIDFFDSSPPDRLSDDNQHILQPPRII
jgi:hypothetical protein